MGALSKKQRSPIEACLAGPRASVLYVREGNPPSSGVAPVSLTSPDGWVPDEPSTVWTGLPVDARARLTDPPPAPTYVDLTPAQRAVYLKWLGRPSLRADVAVGYARLYYYGLERRMFGHDHETAAAEILALRHLFPDRLLHLLSCQSLCCGWLFHRSFHRIAHWVSDQEPVMVPLAFAEAVTWLLLFGDIPFRPPCEWVFRWATARESRRRSAASANLRFRNRIAKLLDEESLLERFRKDPPALAIDQRFHWKIGNSSQYFQSFAALALDFPSALPTAGFLAPFREAYWEETLALRREEHADRKKQMFEEQDSWSRLKDQELAEKAWSEYVGGVSTARGPG